MCSLKVTPSDAAVGRRTGRGRGPGRQQRPGALGSPRPPPRRGQQSGQEPWGGLPQPDVPRLGFLPTPYLFVYIRELYPASLSILGKKLYPPKQTAAPRESFLVSGN